MAFVIAVPDFMAAVATDLAGIGSTISAANAAAAGNIEAVLAAGADEVSAAVAAVFGAHALSYQAVSAQAAVFHDQFVQALTAGAGSYAAADPLDGDHRSGCQRLLG
ncbi:PE family protein, partial [Mycobacterium persicum]|uniref:PE family protein n=1 Tax=Mycobacterium persicum TaxID=1487726 RepID=UPI00159380D4